MEVYKMDFSWDSVSDWLVEHGTRIAVILILGMILWLLLKKSLPSLVKKLVIQHSAGDSEKGMENRSNTLVGVFKGTSKILIIIIVILMILTELDVPIGPVLAGLGIASLAVGFGAQYLIRDLIAGSFIIMENQYRVGDRVKIGDVFGLVEQVNLRKTVVRDWDGMLHHIPNGVIDTAGNATRNYGRVNLDVPVSYGTDLEFAIKIINQVCTELANDEDWKDKIRETPQVLRINNFGDSGIDIKIVGEVKTHEQWAVTGELRLRLKKAFDIEGIEIPWPHTKIYFGDIPDQLLNRA